MDKNFWISAAIAAVVGWGLAFQEREKCIFIYQKNTQVF